MILVADWITEVDVNTRLNVLYFVLKVARKVIVRRKQENEHYFWLFDRALVI